MGAGSFFAGLAKGFGDQAASNADLRQQEESARRKARISVVTAALPHIQDPTLQAEALSLIDEFATGKSKAKGGLAEMFGPLIGRIQPRDEGQSEKLQEFLTRPRQAEMRPAMTAESAGLPPIPSRALPPTEEGGPPTITASLPPVPGTVTQVPAVTRGTRGPLATPEERTQAAVAGKTAELQAEEPFKEAAAERAFAGQMQLHALDARARLQASLGSWQALPEPVTTALKLPTGFRVPPNEMDSYIRIWEKSKEEPSLKFESHVDENTGDVTTVGRNLKTGKLEFQDVVRGIAKKRPQVAVMNQAQKDAAIESAAQSLAGGDMSRLRDIVSLRGDQRLQVFARARELNPKFSTAEIDRKIKMEDAFTNGKDGQNLQSFGIFLEHAAAASEAINAIRQSDARLLNRPLNWWKKNLSGDPNYQAFTTSLEPVRKEFEGFLLGGRALYADDRKAAETILSDNSSPAQIQAALKQMGHTAKARFDEMNYRYRRVMGRDLQEPFSPGAIAAAARIGVDLMGSSKNGSGRGAISSVPGTVKMKAPDGSVESVPTALVEHYKSLGAVEVK